MKTIIDESAATVTIVDDDDKVTPYPMASAAGFKAASDAWLRVGWDAKHVYSFTWMGRPIIQLPEDMVRLQELIWLLKPNVVIETGVAHGGSLIYYASLFEAMGEGRVIGIDIEIRKQNREAIEAHPMFKRIALLEGSSTAPEILEQVKALVRPDDNVMVILDSNHSFDHVLAELHAYADFLPVGGFMVSTDGIMQNVVGAPRSQEDWGVNNPQEAARKFVAQDCRFELEEPEWLFNEGVVAERVTYWPSCFVKRLR